MIISSLHFPYKLALHAKYKGCGNKAHPDAVLKASRALNQPCITLRSVSVGVPMCYELWLTETLPSRSSCELMSDDVQLTPHMHPLLVFQLAALQVSISIREPLSSSEG